MTAKEFLKTLPKDSNWELSSIVENAMIEFAKYHVEQALKEASIKATAYNKAKFKGDINPQVDIDSILNSYLLENIK